jgi:hypothetical protein
MLVMSFYHRQVVIPENDPVNSKIHGPESLYLFLEAGKLRVRDSRTQN